MNETPHGSSRITAIACALAVLLVMLVALFMLRDRLRAEMHASVREQSLAQEKLGDQLDRLKTSVDTLATAAQPSNESLAAMDSKLVAMDSTLADLNARLEAIEKKPAEAKPEPLPVAVTPPPAPPAVPAAQTASASSFTTLALMALSGKPYAAELEAWEKTAAPDAKTSATLRAFASSGIPSETDLLRELRRTLDTLARQPSAVDDVSMVGKINTHLAGLVSIKKSGADKNDAYSTIWAALEKADIARLIESVERLDEPTRAPLEAWLKTANARADTLAIFAPTNPQSGL